MILFLEDWDKYPNAIVDINSSNQTFVRYSALLKSMGVKNHAFPLALMNPQLQGVDPFSLDLSLEQMAMIAVECRDNPMYYFREIARAPGRGSPEPVPFKANRGNMAVFWLYFNHITPMLIQIRQTGKSFSVDSLLVYLQNIKCVNNMITVLTKDDTLRAFNSERIRDIQSELPFYLNQKTKADIANTEEITVKSLGNTIRLLVPNKSPKAALNIGRGLSVGTQIIDEIAFLYNIGITLPAALAAGTAVRDAARRNGDPYGTIMMTTAGKKDDKDGAFVYNLLMRSAVWTEAFFDAKNLQDLEAMVARHSPSGELRVNCTFSHRQLGYDDEWLMRAIQDAMVSGEDADRDFFNRWTSGSMSSPLTVEMLQIIRESENATFFSRVTEPHNYITRWHIPEQQIESFLQNNDVIMSIDSSDAVGGDDIGLVMRSARTGEVVAAGNFNETNLITFCEFLTKWLVDYKRITLIIERRSTGAMIIDYLIMMLLSKSIDPFARIYNKVVQEREEKPDRFAKINKPLHMRDNQIYVDFKKEFGFATSSAGATSRNELYSTTLLNAARYTGDRVRDPIVIQQLLGLTVRNGRVDHQTGGNDDMCIAWLLSAWLLFRGKNLDFYGINSREVLVDNMQRKAELGTPEDRYEKMMQEKTKQEIIGLTEQLKNERDWFISQKIEQRIQTLVSQIKITDEEKISLDNLIQQLKENKKQATRNLLGSRYRY